MVGVGVCCVRGGIFGVGGVCVVLGWDICGGWGVCCVRVGYL